MSAATAVLSRYFSGNAAPVTDEVTVTDLPVTGRLPAELDGRYLYIGSNPITPPDPARYNVFTGDGMVHGLRLRDGRAETYRNRWVRTCRVCSALGEAEVPGPVRGLTDNANTGIATIGGRTMALVDAGGLPVELTGELDTIARTDLDGTLPNGFTSHPARDPVTGELYAVAYYHELSHVQYLILGVDGKVRRAEPIAVRDNPMMHELSLTERFAILYDLPVTYDRNLMHAGSLLPYRWNPEHGARLGVLPREGGDADVRWFDVQQCFVFHPLNAYEDGERIVIDVIRYPQVFGGDSAGVRGNRHTLWRWVIDLATGTVGEEQLLDYLEEFPRIDERRTGRAYRYGYAVAYHEDKATGLAGHGLRKHDMVTGRVELHDCGPGRAAGEGLFVPRDPDAGEDDGWLLSFVYDASLDRSDLVVLSAADFTGEPVAVIHLPVRVPAGFHGTWVAT
jgi:carotenoid cleavage dioxygenase-like enzyme